MSDIAGYRGPLPDQLILTGNYNERRSDGTQERGECSYTVTLSQNGILSGSGLDQAGRVSIEGKLAINSGDIVWKEITGDGDATSVMWGSCNLENERLILELFYKSDYLSTLGEMWLSAQVSASGYVVESNERKSVGESKAEQSQGDGRKSANYSPVVVGIPVSGDHSGMSPGRVVQAQCLS